MQSSPQTDGPQVIGIVGGGILGLAIGRELTRRLPGVEIQLFEKEPELAVHQTGHNSGVVHAGIYYKPGSLKAELCTRGRHLLKEFCKERQLPYDECGKLVVAVDPSEMGRLDNLEKTATENAVPGLRRVDAAEIQEIEPHGAGLAALHSPYTAITDFVAVANAYADDIRAADGHIHLSTPVSGIRRHQGKVEITAGSGSAAETHTVDRLVICAGLQSDRVAESVDGERGPRIVPFRGEYVLVKPEKRDLIKGLIYPVPDPQYPFLGVHFTRRVGGEVDVGPNAILALNREGYNRTDIDLADVADFLRWPGFWQLAKAHWQTGVKELKGSLSIKAYMAGASRYVPEIGADDVVRWKSGIRAQAVGRDGSLVDDFRISDNDGIVSVRNAPSPAATSSLAIAEYVVNQMDLG